MAREMRAMFNLHNETVKRYHGQKEPLLLAEMRDYVSGEEQNTGTSGEHFQSEFWKNAERKNAGENVRRSKKTLRKAYGSNFPHECRPRKRRYSLNCTVMCRSADKELRDNNLETPFMTMAERTKATAVLHEWQTDALTAAAANRQIEGDDAANGTSTPTVRVSNYVQNSTKYAIVTDVQNIVDKAGRGNEMSYQIAKRLGELKRDMELALTQNQASSAGGAATARSSASVESWLATNRTSLGTGTSQTTPGFSSGTVAAPTDSTVTGAFVVGALKAIIKECWNAGGNPGIIMVGAGNKQVVSGFAGIATLYREAGTTAKGTAIVGAADLYISDFGEHRVVPNRFSRNRTALVLDMDYWAVAYLEKVNQKEVARTGTADKRLISVNYTLVSRNEAASGKISDLS